ncbi:5'-nucleotidase C-terminal domain-containing protein [Anaerobacillus sp. CMMVII]|uniref:5'-nucleotidase C-terminal domain-containing protein n=1 Tax=Anaerobacillus sp. CMMVII TaxID=2755588 RepID=UPI0021B7532A|nr:5'-nucleotidase C-terminal domain-containing protein [Anaerobacillus sp. CMMVII]MCT8140481.1 5'-nucleotidase C-terminal domain-containing protein [Anaerobacillus sp. CMMVII]
MKIFKNKMFILTTIFLMLFNYVVPVMSIASASSVVPNLEEVQANVEVTNAEDLFTLSIMHTNDTHAHVEGYPRLFTAVNEIRGKKENTLLVDAGDVFSGTLYFNKYLGQADLYFMNLLGYDAMTFGNHEFDKDSAILANFVKNMEFPMVSSNVNVKADTELGPLFKDEIGTPGDGGSIYPAIIKEFDGEKVGIFGLTTEDTAFLASPGENVIFEDAIEKSKQTVAMLQAEGVNKIIALSHLGYTPDVQLANAVEGIDVIVGGHSHIRLNAPVVINNSEPTIIVQAGEYLQHLGLLDVTFDADGVVTSQNGQLIALAGYEEDAATKTKVLEYKAPLEELRQQVVGSSLVDLNGARNDVRTKETNLGNLIADGMVAKANESVKTHIALQNGGGIRESFPAGDITLGQVLTVLPFGNNLVTLDLTGAELLAALEHSVSEVETAQGKFSQVSGIKFKYDINKPAGQRVWFVEAKTDNGFEVLDLSKTYRIATNAFAADGGDGFTMFKKAKDEGRMTELFVVDFEVFTSYLEKHSPVSPAVEGRIVQAVNPDEPSKHELVIMGTTDIHAHIMPYDYMADAVNQNFGLAKVYTLVQQLRAQHPNTLLVDNGDIIQGSILGDIEAVVDPRKEGETHSIIAAMNMMGYDAAAIGNHEYNFGLPFLDGVVAESNFPWLSANTYNVSNNEHRYEPYVILDREVDGKPIKIGVIGFVPPQVVIWDKIHLNGNVYVNEIVETAKKYVPEMKEKGADVIVVASHSGFDLSENASENASYQLSQVEGINALITGHQHYVFPSARYETTPGADIEKGTLNGVPTVMPGAWGDHLGVIKLQLANENGSWTVIDGGSQALPTKDFEADVDMVALIKDRHEQTIAYVNSPVGSTATPLNTFFSRVAPNKVVQLINDAQLEFAGNYFAGTEYENIPLLSAAAPFKAGRNGVSYLRM